MNDTERTMASIYEALTDNGFAKLETMARRWKSTEQECDDKYNELQALIENIPGASRLLYELHELNEKLSDTVCQEHMKFAIEHTLEISKK